MRLDNTKQGELAALIERVRRLEAQAPIGNSSVTRGRLRVASEEGLVIEGSASVTGILKGIGSFLWNGIVTLTSTFTANGPWNLNGVGTITGNSTQTGDMTVNSPGKIVVAGSNPMTLGVGAFGIPGVGFSSGGGVSGFAGGALLHGGSAGVGCIVNSTIAQLASGSAWVSVKSTGVEVEGPLKASAGLTLTNLPTITAVGKTPNLWQDPTTKIVYRLV